MQKIYLLPFLIVFGLFGITISCSSSNSVSQKEISETKPENNWTLEDHLRRKVSVRIVGAGANARVVIRGESSTINPTSQPLFVIDGQKLGHSFSNANGFLHKGEIRSVEVLPPSRSAQYGMEGHYGVIVIHTKTGDRNS